MKFFVKPTEPAPARSDYSQKISIGLAGILTIMLVMQLFTFDEFILLADTYELPGFSGVGFASLVIVFELLALPFLLRMAVSPAFRWLSAGAVAASVLLWLYGSVITVFSRDIESVGFSGALGTLTPGWWAVFFAGMLCTMAAWSLWGLWPGARSSAGVKSSS